ncbi:hypothetical protein [Vibrio marisflavi]|nr:hypothetical protein [Vibrio marisflavi]
MKLFLLGAALLQLVIATQSYGLFRSIIEMTAFLTVFVLCIHVSVQKSQK